MFESITNSFSWAGFAVILIVILATGFVYFKLVNPRLSRLNYQGGQERYNIHLVDRLVAVILGLAILICFIMVNPTWHSLIVLFLLLIFYETLLNFATGSTLIIEAKLREGIEVEIGNSQGVLKSLKWTGLTVSEGSKSEFLPYRKVFRDGVSVVQGNIPQIVTLRCRWKNEMESQQAQTLLQGKLFSFPFLINGTKPSYLVGEKEIKVSVALTNSDYISSLSDMLQQAGFSVEMINV